MVAMALPDKDKPWTWIRFQNGMCSDCYGNCCTMPVEIKFEDLIRLELTDEDEISRSPKKVAKRLIKEGIVQSYREATGLFMLTSRPNGDCYYLDPITRLCRVYENRPGVCREFPKVGPRPGFCPKTRKNT